MVNCNSHDSELRPEKTRVVLRDVAQRAGVSVMTVSRALRHGRQVSPRLRAKLRRLAARMGYRPDPHLAALVAYRHRSRPRATQAVLAYLTSYSSREAFRSIAIAREAFEGAVARGLETGYRVEHVWLRDLTKRHRDPSAVLRARGIRGLILARLPSVDMRLDLSWSKFSCVGVGYSVKELIFHTVASHLFQDVLLAFDSAVARGYRRPALVLSRELDERTQHQFHGAFLARQSTLPAADRIPVLWSSENVRPGDLRIYLARHAPDVLLSTWPLAWRALQELNLRPPRAIGFVDLCLEKTDGEIAGVYQNFRRIGRAAVDRLNFLLQIGECGAAEKPEVTALYGEWIDGRTVR